MKKTLVARTGKLFLNVVLAVVVLALYRMSGDSLAYVPGGGIIGSPHDFTKKLGADLAEGGNNLACILCHIPSGKSNAGDTFGPKEMPLWDRGTSVKIYASYSNGDQGNHQSKAELLSAEPGSISRFCLGCHDGTNSSNRYGKVDIDSRVITMVLGSSQSNVIGSGGNLSNHHPIGFDYELVRTVKKSLAPDSYRIGSHAISDLLSKGRVECTTCHSVHNSGNTGEKLLWVSDRGSGLCLSCHMLDRAASLR